MQHVFEIYKYFVNYIIPFLTHLIISFQYKIFFVEMVSYNNSYFFEHKMIFTLLFKRYKFNKKLFQNKNANPFISKWNRWENMTNYYNFYVNIFFK